MAISRSFVRSLLACWAILFSAASRSEAEVSRFLAENCQDCHDGEAAEASFDITGLSRDLSDPETLAHWVTLFDRVERGEMPPADSDQPLPEARSAFISDLRSTLVNADRDRQARTGRTVLRRLNREEYERTIESIFGMPQPIASALPVDTIAHGFDNVGEAMRLSYVQIDSYLQTLDNVLDRATVHRARPPRQKFRLSYRNTPWMLSRGLRQPVRFLEDGVEIFGRESFAWLSTTMEQHVVPVGGRYKVRVSGYAQRSDSAIPITVRAGGSGFHGSFTEATTTLGFFDLEPRADNAEATVIEWTGWLEAGRYLHVYPTMLPKRRYGASKIKQNLAYDGPSVVIQWVEVDGPIFDQWPPLSHTVLYGDTPLEPIPGVTAPTDPNAALLADSAGFQAKRSQTNRSTNEFTPPHLAGPHVGPLVSKAIYRGPLVTHRLSPGSPKQAADELIRRFAKQVFPRPPADGELDRYVALVHRWLDDGSEFEEAMQAGFKAILTSPKFLFFQESVGPLDEIAVAQRLAYFLTGQPADAELQRAARTGELASPDELRRHTNRLLAQENSRRTFVEEFVDRWLDLRNIEFTSPDVALYPEFDELLLHSMAEETYRFFDDALVNDRPVQTFIGSDYTFANARLAEVYGLTGVEGSELRKVSLPEASVRGGVMTQASVLKVSANGTTTSPVVRGLWVLDRIVGRPSPPPPPGVPAVEPDIRGLSTIRDQLAKHREIESCSRCHQHIDPPGFALEAFDPIGNFRDAYRVVPPKNADIRIHPGSAQPVVYVDGPTVDPSYELADGTPFQDVRDYKNLLLKDPNLITRTLASKLVTYATGASISFADRAAIAHIVQQVADDGHGLKTLIHAIVQSDLFLNK